MLIRTARLALVPIALALPASAQQRMSDQQARQVAEGALSSWNQAFRAKDPAGLAAQYTNDYVMIGPPPEGSMSGRAAMEKHWAA
jgi:ketosteroid isomerase-like protein